MLADKLQVAPLFFSFSLAGESALDVFTRHLRLTLLDHLWLEAALDAYLRSKGKNHKQLDCRKERPQLPGSNSRPSIPRVVFCSSQDCHHGQFTGPARPENQALTERII